MLGFKSLWTTTSDWKSVGRILIETLRLYPRLVWWNSLLVATVLGLSYLYFNFVLNFDQMFMPPALKDLYISLINFCFMVIVWSFVIFLIPYQLYNYFMKQSNQSSGSLKFNPFLAKHLWPVIIETLKAFVVISAYAGIGLLLWTVIFVISILFVGGVKEQMNQMAISLMTLLSSEGINLKSFLAVITELKSMGVLFAFSFVCLLPATIKGIQYMIVPFVTIFNKEFPSQKSSLKISQRLSHGLVLPFFLLFSFFFLISVLIPMDEWIQKLVGDPASLGTVYVLILLGSLKYIFYTGFFCMAYFNQDKTVLK